MYNYFFENIEKELSLADFFTRYCDSSLFYYSAILNTSKSLLSISDTLTSAIALNVSNAVITPIFLSIAALLIKNPSLLESLPFVGVFTTKSTSLFLTTSNIFGSSSLSLLTSSQSIPASLNSLQVPSVAINLYPALAKSLAIGKNSALSCLLIVAKKYQNYKLIG